MASPRSAGSWRTPRAPIIARANPLVARAESAEMAAATSFIGATPPSVKTTLGVRLERIDGAIATVIASADVLALNRVIGVGVTGPSSERQLDRIMTLYADSGVPRWMVQVVPGAEPSRLGAWLSARGLEPLNRWVRLVRPLAQIERESLPDGIEIRRAEKRDAELFAHLVVRSFGMPDGVGEIVAASVGRLGWHHAIAWAGTKAIGTGALYTAGDVAWFGFAAVAEQARRLGVHRAMVLHRMAEAQRLGCTEACVETAEPTETNPAPSYRNMLSLGFQERYRRQNWVFKEGS